LIFDGGSTLSLCSGQSWCRPRAWAVYYDLCSWGLVSVRGKELEFADCLLVQSYVVAAGIPNVVSEMELLVHGGGTCNMSSSFPRVRVIRVRVEEEEDVGSRGCITKRLVCRIVGVAFDQPARDPARRPSCEPRSEEQVEEEEVTPSPG